MPILETTVEFWRDPLTRSFVVQRKDMAGNQIGDAIYVATRREAATEAAKLTANPHRPTNCNQCAATGFRCDFDGNRCSVLS